MNAEVSQRARNWSHGFVFWFLVFVFVFFAFLFLPPQKEASDARHVELLSGV